MARILIGMSGGVDSSVAAGLLAREGHEVVGVTLKLWEGADETAPEARWQDRSCCKVGIARFVCDRLGIAHRVVDLREAFRRQVVDDFTATYLDGQTPNPCVRCNAFVKFHGLLDLAEAEGFDAIATGHYARIERDGTGRRRLLKGLDPAKDQSYFLHRLAAPMLSRIRFPLGGLRKPQVMQMAREMGFPADEIAESQEICFVGQDDYRGFLARHAPAAVAPGDIVTTGGRVVGRHQGVALHTIGQRRGLSVALGERLYVVATHPETRQVVVGPEDALYRDRLTAHRFNTLAPLPESGRVLARIRYRGTPTPAHARLAGDRLELRFDAPQKAVAPGQSVVLYHGDMVLGGGVIAPFAEASPQAVHAA